MFVYGITKWSSFIFSMYLSIFPNTTYWRNYCFSIVYSCLLCHRLVDHMSKCLFLDSRFCSISFLIFIFIFIFFYCCSSTVVSIFCPLHSPLPQPSPLPTLYPTPFWLCPCVHYTCFLTTLTPLPPLAPSTSPVVTISLFLFSVSLVRIQVFAAHSRFVSLSNSTWKQCIPTKLNSASCRAAWHSTPVGPGGHVLCFGKAYHAVVWNLCIFACVSLTQEPQPFLTALPSSYLCLYFKNFSSFIEI